MPDITVVTDEADNCTVNPVVAFVSDLSDGNSCPEVITRTYSVTDACGNTINVTQTITIDDTTNPTASNPAPVTVQCTGDVPVPDITVVTDEADNCTVNPVVAFVSDLSDGNSCPEVITRTYSVTDACGNTINVTQTITIDDTIDPTISCVTDQTRTTDTGACTYTSVGTEFDPIATGDNCAVASITNDFNGTNTLTGEIFPVGVTTVIWTITDNCGNSAACSFDVTVTDNELPAIVCPPDLIDIPADSGECFATGVILGVPVTSDNCGVQSVTNNAPLQFPAGLTIVTWTVTDNNGNIATCGQNVTVVDTEFPTFTVPAAITIYKDATCGYDASVTVTGDVTDEADNCDTTLEATFTDDVVAGSCEGEQIITRTWSLSDNYDNTTTHDQIITVADNTPPTFTRPIDITIYTDASCNYDITVGNVGDVTDEADNCSTGLNATFVDAAPVAIAGCEGGYTIQRTWSLTDNCGNAAADQIQTITIRDNTPPTFTRPIDITIYTDASCNYNITVGNVGDVTDEADNCSTGLNATFVDAAPVAIAGCEGGYTIQRTWSLTDNCGNAAADQVQTITVRDNTAPTFTRPMISRSTQMPAATITSRGNVGDVTDEADNCSTGLNATYGDAAPVAIAGCEGGYTIQRTWSLTDNCGNAAADQVQTITVRDNTAPTFTRPIDITIYTDASCNYNIRAM